MKKINYVLIGVLLFILAFRLYFNFSAHNFNDSTTYFNLRQIDSITETGKPIFNDPLSYSGRINVFSPVFHYILAFFSLFIPEYIVAKILPQLFCVLTAVAIYLITFYLTENRLSGIVAAFTSAFIPVLIKESLNNLNEYSLIIPLIFFLIYFFMRINSGKYLNYYLFFIFIAVLVHPFVALFIIGTVFYLLLIKTESMKLSKREFEVILLSAFLMMWVIFLVYKKAFLTLGPGVIYHNIPTELLNGFFRETSIPILIYNIGILPFVFGLYSAYRYVFMEKNRSALLLISCAIAVSLLLWFKLIELNIGLIFLGLFISIFFGMFHSFVSDYFTKTKLAELASYFQVTFLILVFFTMFFPAVNEAYAVTARAYPDKVVDALEWLSNNTPAGAVVAAPLDEGHLVNAIAKRKNIIDTNYIMIDNIDARYRDIERLYITPFETEAISILNKYNATYIVLTQSARKTFGIQGLSYISDEKCFALVYSDEVDIYESRCVLS